MMAKGDSPAAYEEGIHTMLMREIQKQRTQKSALPMDEASRPFCRAHRCRPRQKGMRPRRSSGDKDKAVQKSSGRSDADRVHASLSQPLEVGAGNPAIPVGAKARPSFRAKFGAPRCFVGRCEALEKTGLHPLFENQPAAQIDAPKTPRLEVAGHLINPLMRNARKEG